MKLSPGVGLSAKGNPSTWCPQNDIHREMLLVDVDEARLIILPAGC